MINYELEYVEYVLVCIRNMDRVGVFYYDKFKVIENVFNIIFWCDVGRK